MAISLSDKTTPTRAATAKSLRKIRHMEALKKIAYSGILHLSHLSLDGKIDCGKKYVVVLYSEGGLYCVSKLNAISFIAR